MGGRLRGCLWLTAGLIVAIVAGFIGFMTLSNATTQRSGQSAPVPQVTVVVAAWAVPVRSALKPEDLTTKTMPVDVVPDGALRTVNEAVGGVTLADLYAGETVLKQRLVDPNTISGNGRYAIVMAEDQVLMAFPAADLMSKAGVLKPGDHVDMLFSLAFPKGQGPGSGTGGATAGGGAGSQTSATGQGGAGPVAAGGGLTTWDALQNVTISAVVGGTAPATGQTAQGTTTTAGATSPDALLLILSPQDALVLKYLKDSSGIVDLVLRAPGNERPFKTEPVDLQYLIDRYQVPQGGK